MNHLDRPGRDGARLPPRRRVAARQPETASAIARSYLFVCHGPSCSERGAEQLLERLGRAVADEREARGGCPIRLCRTTCLDSCATGPNVLLAGEDQVQTGVEPEGAQALVERIAAARRGA